jgi:hypothetical protein
MVNASRLRQAHGKDSGIPLERLDIHVATVASVSND